MHQVIAGQPLSVPEIVHLTVITPYPGTEIWHAQDQKLTTRDYRLFDIQHAVLPTKLPLPRFYEELGKTQGVLNRKFMGPRTAPSVLGILARQLAHGQTNFLRMLWKFNSVYDARRQYGEHFRPVHYELPLPIRRHPLPLIGRLCMSIADPRPVRDRHSRSTNGTCAT